MKAYLGLGSNLGDRTSNLLMSVRRLHYYQGVEVDALSPLYETEPIGGPEQPRYLNAAVVVNTSIIPDELFMICREIEHEMGRVRVERWGPRTIDIDILLYGDMIIKSGDIEIPHPRMHVRGFVLRPLADIAPDAVHPVLGVSVGELLSSVSLDGVREYTRLKLKDIISETPK